LSRQLEKGEWLAVCENIAYETGSTIPQILKEVGETAQANPTIVHEAVGKIRTAIKAAENAHEIIEPGSSISFKVGQPAEKVLGVTKVKIDKETYKHIFRGGFNKKRKRGTGLHVGRNNPVLMEKIINKPNKHGIYEAFWKHPQGKYLKPSTIAPDNWNYVEYMTHANEALENIVEAYNPKTQPVNFRVRGIDNLGIKWEAWIKKLNNDLAKIESIYPTYK